MPNLRNGSKGGSNPGLLDCESKKINDTKSQRIKEQLQTIYSILDKEVKRKTKAGKRASIENIADAAETAAHMQNMATLYKITKALAGCSF